MFIINVSLNINSINSKLHIFEHLKQLHLKFKN